MEIGKTITMLVIAAIFCVIGFLFRESIEYLCTVYLGVSALLLGFDLGWDTETDSLFDAITSVFTVGIFCAYLIDKNQEIFISNNLAVTNIVLAMIVINFSLSSLLYTKTRSD